jgi:hypothetical protein
VLAVRYEGCGPDLAADADAVDGNGLVAKETYDGRRHHPADVVEA